MKDDISTQTFDEPAAGRRRQHGRANPRLRDSEERLEAELSGSRLLQRLSTRLIPEQSPEALYDQILDTALELMRADAVSIQLLHEDGKRLRRVATRNLHPDSTEYWTWVDATHASTCGQALSKNERVVVEDVEASPELGGTGDLEAFRASGTRAVQSTPLLTRTGRPVGMISTHWRTPRRIEESDFGLFDILAREVADLFERSKAEVALRESERKYRSLFETMGQGYCELELIRDERGKAVDQLYLELNPAFERLFGIAAADARGRKASEVFPFVDPIWTERFDEVAATGTFKRFEHQHGPLGAWFEAFVYPRGGDRVVVLYEEITDRKRAEIVLRESEERHAFLLRFTDAIRSEPTGQKIVARATRMLAEQLALDRCYVTRLYPSRDLTEVIHEVRGPDLAPIPSLLRNSDFPEAFRQTFEKTLVFEDTANDPALSEADKAALASLNFGALLSRPLRRDGLPVFAVGAVSSQPRRWTAEEIALVEDATERTWTALERARGETALAASEEKYRTIFESIDEGFALVEVMLDHEGNPMDLLHVETNPAYERHTGLGNVVGKRALEIAPDFDRTWLSFYDEVARTGEAADSEYYVAAPVDRWFTVHASRVGGEGSRKVAVVFNDVTERKCAEAADRESRERQAFLLTLSDALRMEPDADAMALFALRTLSERLQLDRCYIAEYRLEEDRGDIPYQVGNDRVLPFPDSVRLSDFPEALKIALGGTLVIDDVDEATFLSDDDKRNMQRLGIVGLVTAAARKGENRPLFAIVAVSAAPRKWTPGEIALIEEVNERTWAALERARAERALRTSEQHQRLLLAELQHRVRNTLAVVRSIARRTADNSSSVEQMIAHFQGRLDAFSRVQSAVTRSADGLIELTSLIEDEMVAHATREGEQLRIKGPAVAIDSRTAERLSLAIHELTTNAVKHGALMTENGTVSIRWALAAADDGDVLGFHWTENGVQNDLDAPRSEGFGMELLLRSLPYDLQAESTLELRSDGLDYLLRLPLPRRS